MDKCFVNNDIGTCRECVLIKSVSMPTTTPILESQPQSKAHLIQSTLPIQRSCNGENPFVTPLLIYTRT